VYPDPEPVLSGTINYNSLQMEWILIVFIIDFFIDILIVYIGVYLLDKNNLINNFYTFDFPKITFLFAVFIISVVGLFSEIFFGAWVGGLVIALILIFLSFVIVSKYILKLNWANSIRLGLFAAIVNIIVWIVIFSI
jgi:hypothetical protein